MSVSLEQESVIAETLTGESVQPETVAGEGEDQTSQAEIPRPSESTIYSTFSGASFGSLSNVDIPEAAADENAQEVTSVISKTDPVDAVAEQEDKQQGQAPDEQQETVETTAEQTEETPQHEVEKTETTGDEIKAADVIVDLVLQDETQKANFALMEDDDEGGSQDFIMIEEIVMDDLGKEVKIKQKVPIIREIRHFERVSIPGGDAEHVKTHKYLETITRVIKTSTLNEEGNQEEKETELKEIIEHDQRPEEAETVYAKRTNEMGEVEEYVVPIEEVVQEVPEEPEEIKREYKKKEEKEILMEKKKVLKIVKDVEVEPCSFGKLKEVSKPTMAEIEVEIIESESEEEDFFEEDLSESEQAHAHEQVLRRREARIAKLKDNLRTVLVRLALAEKKRNLYMQLISISSEVKEDILNPPDPDKPTFKVPKKVKSEDKFRRMYAEKLMEYRELRSVILVKLAMEKKRKQEVKQKYDVIASEVAQLRKLLEDKLAEALQKLLPKHDPVFKNQSPQAMVKRVIELMERLDNETKELMYKKKQMYLAKQKYDELTENEMGLSYKYALASKELKELVSKNDRRNEKLESLKTTMQKESMAVAHINQKCEAILKTTDEKNAKLQFLNQSLIRARQDRKDVHQARRKVETELRQENAKIKQKNHPSLLREYLLVQDLLRAKQSEFQQLKKECLSSLEQMKRMTGSNLVVSSPRQSEASATRSQISPAKLSS